jgi:hypothetical protein
MLALSDLNRLFLKLKTKVDRYLHSRGLDVRYTATPIWRPSRDF